ncbi:NTP transferase domain-containing protein [Candidatus Wolfebacteria bacterium]|nr:NTP transferase domain-containing protein [Candidatus Wolfebacteria bacterium]
MKTIILCGGQGTRMKEETEFKPKPLVFVGGKPILWHIMKIYSHHGFNDFILALGYKGDMIKDYFLNHKALSYDFTLNTKTGEIFFHNDDNHDDFKITFIDTGLESLTGERIRRLKNHIQEDNFMVTYGDGVADIDIKDLLDFHKKKETLATITAIKPVMRFGFLNIDHNEKKVNDFYQHKVTNYNEVDDKDDRGHINGGFMVFKRDVLDMIPENSMIESIFAPLAQKGELSAYLHPGRWKCMDTYKEVEEMNKYWENDPFWKVWEA